MKTPYELLDVSRTASDNEIKLAYLQKVKLYPPERNQEKFQQHHVAFEAIKDKKSRNNYELFHYAEISFEDMLEPAFNNNSSLLINGECFDKLLSTSINDKTYLINLPNSENSA